MLNLEGSDIEMMNKNKNDEVVLLFEPEVSGHHFEFLAYLVRYANQRSLTDCLALVVCQEFVERYIEFYPESDIDASKFQSLRILSSDELEWLQDKSVSVLKRHRRVYDLMHKVAADVGASHIHADSFNMLQLFTHKKSQELPTLSCIFYGPFTRQECGGSFSTQLKGRLSVLRRKIFFWRAMRSRRFKSVFLLNDQWSADELNASFSNDGCCHHLADPVWSSDFFQNTGRSLRNLTSCDRKQILFFGTIREDKGSLILLRALSKLPEHFQERLSIIYSGVVSNSEKERFLKQYKATKQNAPKLKIEFREGYADYGAAAELYRSSDLVAIPYLRADRSSGVLNNSVLFGKEVLASGFGLIGHLVNEFQLGISLPHLNEKSLADAVMNWLDRSEEFVCSDTHARFLSEHRPEVYAATIFKPLGLKRKVAKWNSSKTKK